MACVAPLINIIRVRVCNYLSLARSKIEPIRVRNKSTELKDAQYTLYSSVYRDGYQYKRSFHPGDAYKPKLGQRV